MGKSYVKVFRSARDNWLWQETPFDRWHAFEYLFMWAAWQPEERLFHGNVFKVPRGHHITTLRQLSRDWGWSKNKVSRFLKSLQKCDMIGTKTDHGCIVVSLCNYDKWQGGDGEADHERNGKGPEADQRRTTDGPEADHRRATREERTKKGEEVQEGKEGAAADRGNPKLLRDAYAKVDFFKSENVKLTVKEYLGFMEQNPFIPYARIHEISSKLHALRESLNMSEGIPADKIFSYAVGEALKAKAVSASYIGKVIQNSVIKWRENALKV